MLAFGVYITENDENMGNLTATGHRTLWLLLYHSPAIEKNGINEAGILPKTNLDEINLRPVLPFLGQERDVYEQN